jgi:hypothetical protein
MLVAVSIILLFLISLFIIVNTKLEPVLRSRLNTLIITGSDSLYNYKLATLETDVFGGNVEVSGLQIFIDSSRYKALQQKNMLPALTMQLDMQHGHIRGIGIISLLFGKRIRVEEILTKEAQIKLSRHPHKRDTLRREREPLWKMMQPKINSISIRNIKFEGIKVVYSHADTTEAVHLQFGRCNALLHNIEVDSTSAADTSRIGFMKTLNFNFYDLGFLTMDSVYKMHAAQFSYSSEKREVALDSFHMEPTLAKEAYINRDSLQRTLYNVLFDKVKISNIRIDRFIRYDVIEADSISIHNPSVSIYLDRTLPPSYQSKIGKYPHQEILNTGSILHIKGCSLDNLELEYTEKNSRTQGVGTIKLDKINVQISNITNDPELIHNNPYCIAKAKGTIFGTSPIEASFRFYMDSTNGRFDVEGSMSNITAAQVNTISLPLADIEVQSLNVRQLLFHVKGEDFTAKSTVRFLYTNASFVFRKTDEETGVTKRRKFITKLVKKITYPQNPGPDGRERTGKEEEVARLTTESFFGLIWKSIFAGVQSVMLK